MVTGAAAFGAAARVERRDRGCSVQKMASYAIGNMIRTYNTCEVNDLRAQTDGTISVAVQAGRDGQFLARARGRYEVSSYKFARRSFLRAAGGSAALLAPLLRSIEARAQGMAAPLRLLIIHHPLGRGAGAGDLAAERDRHDDQLHAAARERAVRAAATPLQKYMCMIDGLNMVTTSGQNTHEGGMVADDDRRQRARARSASRTARRAARRSISSCSTSRRCWADRRRRTRRRSDRCSWPRTCAPTATRSRRACCRTGRRIAGTRHLPGAAAAVPGDAAAQRVQPHLRRRRCRPGPIPPKLLAQKLSVLDFMRKDLARMQTLIPASEKDRLAAHADRDHSSSRRACGRRTASMPNTVGLHEAGDAARRTPTPAPASR